MKLDCSQLIKNQTSFLVDTGADISLIKLRQLKDNTKCYENNPISLKGIDNNSSPISTICCTFIDIMIENQLINHCFHVVHDDFPIPFDGIIGNDFIKKYRCSINYENNYLEIQSNRIPLFHLSKSINLKTSNSCIISNSNSNSNSNSISSSN